MSSDCPTPMAHAIWQAYRRDEEDEAMPGLHLVDAQGDPTGCVDDGDYIVFYNIRGEREVQLALSLTQPGFDEFPTKGGMTTHMATMIQYDPRITDQVAFPPIGEIAGTLSEALSRAGLRHAKVCESEKAVHITQFMNGKRAEPFPGEERVVIESNREVNDFDELPEMNAADVADATIARLRDPDCPVIITNLANMDVVGHIEDREAVIHAIEAVDEQVGRIIHAAEACGVTALVTADHGTVEKWYYAEGTVDTGHTDSPVPLVVTDKAARLADGGALTDVAPTLLAMVGADKPNVMTGANLITGLAPQPRRVLLLVVDGWGLNDDPNANLIHQANAPNLDRLLTEYPCTRLCASGSAVGMPDGTVGNSEAGHLHIGAGRVIPSDRLRIEQAMADGTFRSNDAFNWAIEGAVRDGKKLHLLGIISFYSSHGSLEYLAELLHLCADRRAESVYVHGLLGRRGERPESGAEYVGRIEELCHKLGVGRVVSVIGRHWALDREQHWSRVQMAYDLLARGQGAPVCDAR